VHLFGFIIRLYHDARSSECQTLCECYHLHVYLRQNSDFDRLNRASNIFPNFIRSVRIWFVNFTLQVSTKTEIKRWQNLENVGPQTFADSPSLCEEQSNRYWDFKVTVLRQVYLNMKHANKNVLIHKALTSINFSKGLS